MTIRRVRHTIDNNSKMQLQTAGWQFSPTCFWANVVTRVWELAACLWIINEIAYDFMMTQQEVKWHAQLLEQQALIKDFLPTTIQNYRSYLIICSVGKFYFGKKSH